MYSKISKFTENTFFFYYYYFFYGNWKNIWKSQNKNHRKASLAHDRFCNRQESMTYTKDDKETLLNTNLTWKSKDYIKGHFRKATLMKNWKNSKNINYFFTFSIKTFIKWFTPTAHLLTFPLHQIPQSCKVYNKLALQLARIKPFGEFVNYGMVQTQQGQSQMPIT